MKTCPHCQGRMSCSPPRMHFKGLFLFFDGVRCRSCGKTVEMHGVLPGMSLSHIDLFFKLVLIAYTVYLCIQGLLLFISITVFAVLLLNYVMYPLLIAAGFLVAEPQ